MDLSTLTLVQLQDLQKQIPAEIKRREQEEKANVINELKALAEKHGFSLDQLVKNGGGEKGKGRTVKPKYQHPTNPELTWTGRGRKPLWVAELLAQGKTLESIAI